MHEISINFNARINLLEELLSKKNLVKVHVDFKIYILISFFIY